MGKRSSSRKQLGPTAVTESLRRDDTGVYVGDKRYTLGEISRGSGVSRPHVTRVFNGKRQMSVKVARRIAGFMGISLDSLVGFLQ